MRTLAKVYELPDTTITAPLRTVRLADEREEMGGEGSGMACIVHGKLGKLGGIRLYINRPGAAIKCAIAAKRRYRARKCVVIKYEPNAPATATAANQIGAAAAAGRNRTVARDSSPGQINRSSRPAAATAARAVAAIGGNGSVDLQRAKHVQLHVAPAASSNGKRQETAATRAWSRRLDNIS